MTGDTLAWITSQNFEPELDAFESFAADDVRIVDAACRAKQVTVVGVYSDCACTLESRR